MLKFKTIIPTYNEFKNFVALHDINQNRTHTKLKLFKPENTFVYNDICPHYTESERSIAIPELYLQRYFNEEARCSDSYHRQSDFKADLAAYSEFEVIYDSTSKIKTEDNDNVMVVKVALVKQQIIKKRAHRRHNRIRKRIAIVVPKGESDMLQNELKKHERLKYPIHVYTV